MQLITAAGLVAALAIGVEGAPRATEAATVQTVPGTFSTAITVLNPSTNPTAQSIVLDFYDANGNLQSGAEQTATNVAPGATVFWYVPNIKGLTQGQTYSAVVSSDQQVYATVNLGGTNPTTGETYDGAGTDGSALAVNTTEYIPSILKDYYGFSSTIVVQNAGTASTTISINMVGGSTNTTVTSPTLAPNASWTLDLESQSAIPSGFNGAATINGNGQQVAVITNQYTPTASPALFGSTNGFSAGATVAYIPGLYKNYYGFTSALTVQNADTQTANVTVTYSDGATDVVNGLAPGTSHVFYTPNNTGIANGAVVAATVSSNAKILTQVNVQASGTSGTGLASYGGFTAGTTKVFAPGLLKNYAGFNSALTIQNVSTTQTATVQISYSNSSVSYTKSITPGQSLLLYTPNESGLPNGYNGGATVISTNSVPIVGLINIQGVTSSDQLFSTNGFGSN